MLRQFLLPHSIPLIALLTFLSLSPSLLAQQKDLSQGIPAVVDFSHSVRDWDGFGFNYIETAQTRSYATFKQDFGGFSLLSEKRQEEIIRLIFGQDGLQVGLVKILLDPFHLGKGSSKLGKNSSEYFHESSTQHLRSFVTQGLDLTRTRGLDLSILTTLAAPPSHMTQQKQIGSRDLNPKHTEDLAEYMVDWVKYLREIEAFPVDVISLHNGGDLWQNWNGNGLPSSDMQAYNLYWPPEQVVNFLNLIPPILAKEGLEEVKISNGEPHSWKQFSEWGSAAAIYQDATALSQLGLITAQGLGEHQSEGIDLLRSKRPELHAWATASRPDKMGAGFIQEIHDLIYTDKVNGIIPRAGIQRPDHWRGNNPHSGAAITVNKNGTYKIQPEYYFYKQVSRAGQAGTSVVRASVQDPKLSIIGFGQNGTTNPDAFVLINGGMLAHEKGDGIDIRIGQLVHHFNLTDQKANFTYRLGETSPQQQRNSSLNTQVKYARRRTKNGYILEVGIPMIGSRGRNQILSRMIRTDLKIHDRSYFHENLLTWNENGSFKVSTMGDGNATYVETPPVIDALIDKSWDIATKYSANSPEESDFRAQIHVLNTESMLYFLVDVADPTGFGGQEVAIEVKGSSFTEFEAFRTTEDGEAYKSIGTYKVEKGLLHYKSPTHSVTTFYGIK